MEKQWHIWTLSEGDIEMVCERMNVDFRSLSEDEIESIARFFRKGFEFANEDWEDILVEAIREAIGKREVV